MHLAQPLDKGRASILETVIISHLQICLFEHIYNQLGEWLSKKNNDFHENFKRATFKYLFFFQCKTNKMIHENKQEIRAKTIRSRVKTRNS